MTGTATVRGVSVGNPPQKFIPSRGGVINSIRGDDQPIYDRQTIPGGTPVSKFLFFNIGQTAGRTFIDTNLPQPNKLPGELSFTVQGFGVATELGISSADLALFQRALFRLTKNRSRRFELRVSRLGGGGGFSGVGQGAVTDAILQNGPASPNDHYVLKSWIPYQAEDPIGVELLWSTPVTFSTAIVIETTLYGFHGGLVDRT